MLDKNVVSDILNAALSTGGDFAEIFVENTAKNNISLVNGVVDKAVYGIIYGCGIRIFKGFSAIYAYTNDTSKENLLRVAKEAAEAINKTTENVSMPFINAEVENLHKIKIMPENNSKKEIVKLLKVASEASFNYDKNLIGQTGNSYMDTVQNVLIANSLGTWAEDQRVRTRVVISAVATELGEKQTGSFGPGGHAGFEIFEDINTAELGKESAEIAVKMLKAEPCLSGKMPVIIDNGFGGVIFHEACGHGLEATAVAKNASVFAGKLGEKIASNIVTAVDDGSIPNMWGSANIDDEGSKTRKNVLIENGILKTYMIDKLNGIKMGMEPTASSRRESYRFAPTSRMTNTYISAGKSLPRDIISSTEKGLYAKRMGGGSVQPATGEFNFAVTEAYLVENGKITKPVRGATLIGKGHEVIMNIDMVANNLLQEQGMCGSVSGSIPTNVGQPMIRVKELTVGGRINDN